MQMIDINSIDQRTVYTMYERFKSLKEDIESKEEISKEEQGKLKHLEAQLFHIENWANSKLSEKLHWTKEEILSNYGHKPTLIINFHPSTESYKKYGNSIVANIEFNENELLEMLTNIQNKSERKSDVVNFKIVSEKIIGSFETREIFELAGNKV